MAMGKLGQSPWQLEGEAACLHLDGSDTLIL